MFSRTSCTALFFVIKLSAFVKAIVITKHSIDFFLKEDSFNATVGVSGDRVLQSTDFSQRQLAVVVTLLPG